MNPTEIYDALDALGKAPFNAAEFGYTFAEATDNAVATVKKLRTGTTNKSELPDGVLLAGKFHYVPAPPGEVVHVMDVIKTAKSTAKGKPAILVTTDGEMLAAEHPKSGETLHCAFTELGENFAFFFPAAGKERYRAAEENPVDIKATGKLAKLYDALLKRNPDWRTPARRHDMNLFMTRLIFCLFAEDVGIFPEGQFSKVLNSMSGERGEHAREMLVGAFAAMNLPKSERKMLPGWTAEFEYVNGGLFAGNIDTPEFDAVSLRYLRDACALDWKLINPDIFGSMIQSIADEGQRSELGMHYTSVPNIMKVIGPLFLDDLDATISKVWDRKKDLGEVLLRLSRIRVFDPACGSGNFLVVAYRQLRERETRVMQRLAELGGGDATSQIAMFSGVSLGSFYGIEINDFAAETAKLALFIAEYQANSRLAEVIGRMPPLLPLRVGGHITCRNALQIEWENVCPPPNAGEEVFIAGNPPYKGSQDQSQEQKNDLEVAFGGAIASTRSCDYVTGWFMKARAYVRKHNAKAAYVTTNSIHQGRQVSTLWPAILGDDVDIFFARPSFQWSNLASKKAVVTVSIIGIARASNSIKKLFDNDLVTPCQLIGPYLVPNQPVVVAPVSAPLFLLTPMTNGSMPNDGGGLILTPAQAEALRSTVPQSATFIKKLVGSDDVIYDKHRYCLWISDDEVSVALQISEIKRRVALVRDHRLASTRPTTNSLAAVPHQFGEVRHTGLLTRQ